MQVIIHSQNLDITTANRSYIEKKLSHLERYIDQIVDVEAHLSAQRGFKTVEVTVRAGGRVIRAEERNAEIRTAVDQVTDKLEKQIKHFKERSLARERRPHRTQPAPTTSRAEHSRTTETEVEPWPSIVRRKRLTVERMSAEEATERMQLLGHDFFMFLNDDTGEINVVYERLDGNFGVLEPDVSAEPTTRVSTPQV